MEALLAFGYIGLFVAAFLAATILPLSSEVVLSTLLLNGFTPTTLIAVATAGNVLGALCNYGLGYWLSISKVKKWLGLSDDDLLQAQQRFQRYGTFSLLFAWVPIIGDPLTLIAGVLRVHWGWFLLLVTIGKLLRYMVVSHVTQQSIVLF